MKLLVLGASGSVGRKVCEIGLKKGYEVTGADLKPSDFNDVEIIKLDVLNLDELSKVIERVKPDVIVNSLNIATIFFRKSHDNLTEITKFHVGLYPILNKLNSVNYIQIGTTGTGGMGMNVPFSHGEKLSNLPLFYKASYAGTCTILLTLLSRSFNDNHHKISEIKPGLAIFQDNFSKKNFNGVSLVTSDGGENGNYTYDELAILTAFMGFTTAQKIAEKVHIVIDHSTAQTELVTYDIIDALNKTVIAEDKEDTNIKNTLLSNMLAQSKADHVIATGNLGPPSLTRDLILGHLVLKNSDQKIQLEQEFEQAKDQDKSILATLEYIKSVNKTLSDFLIKELNYSNYEKLKVFAEGSSNPWEVLAEKFKSNLR